MGKGLVFITISHPNDTKSKSTQRCIRKRVMREIGQSRRTRSRPAPIWDLSPLVHQSLQASVPDEREAIPRCPDPSNAGYYPIALGSRGLQLVQFMTTEAEGVYRPFRSVWFSMGMTDPSAFMLCLANAAMFWHQATQPDSFEYAKSTECLTYYGYCVAQTTRRLGDADDCVSEGVITTILGMICHDMYVGTWERWHIHASGLRRVILLRGGYDGLSLNARLFLLWFDAQGCVVRDCHPNLPECLSEHTDGGENTKQSSVIVDALIRSPTNDFRDIGTALREAGSVVAFLNSNASQPTGFWRQENSLMAIELLMPATRLLLSMSRLSEPMTMPNMAKEAVRLALLILLAAVKRDLFLFSSDEIPPLLEKFTSLTRESRRHIPEPDSTYSTCTNLWLWALTTVSLSCWSDLRIQQNDCMYFDDICQVAMWLGIQTGREVIHTAKATLWIDESLRPGNVTENVISALDERYLYYTGQST